MMRCENDSWTFCYVEDNERLAQVTRCELSNLSVSHATTSLRYMINDKPDKIVYFTKLFDSRMAKKIISSMKEEMDINKLENHLFAVG